MRTAGFVMAIALAASVADAQTIQPAPTSADGRPDLTGVYQASPRRGGWDAEAPGDEPGVPAPRSAVNINTTASDAIPFTPEARARAQDILNRRSIDDPTTRCIFAASPRISGVGLFPIQFVQTPTQVVVLYEYLWTHRVIPINATHPEDMSPSYMGDSVGRWEGNTLVVDVVGFKPGIWLTGGLVTSDALHLTERYTRVDRDQLTYEVTIEDPKVLTKPFTQRTTLMLREGARLREYSCAENNLDPGVYEKMLQDPAASQSFIRGK
jgi:hypothetical protein